MERLGRPGAWLAAHADETLILGARAELLRAVADLTQKAAPASEQLGRGKAGEAVLKRSGQPLDWGRASCWIPAGLPPSRRCRCHRGWEGPCSAASRVVAWKGLWLSRVTASGSKYPRFCSSKTTLARSVVERNGSDRAGLARSVPSAGAMAVIVLACRPSGEFWDSAFALADRVEKTDSARAQVAPIRIRLTLLARTAGVRLEPDVLQHLRLSAAVFGEPRRPGRPSGALVALHLDSDAAARRLVELSRLGSRTGRSTGGCVGDGTGRAGGVGHRCLESRA